jgi:ATP adenylyltransferase
LPSEAGRPLYNLHAARDEEQLAYMRSLEERAVCLFCRPVLLEDPLQTVSHVGTHWSVVANRYPYAGTKSHQLLVPAEHVRAMHELTPEARAALFETLDLVVDRDGLSDYGVGIRNGDPTMTAASIAHLHVHLFEPLPGAKIRMRFGPGGD